MRLESVDDLELLHLASAGKKIDHTRSNGKVGSLRALSSVTVMSFMKASVWVAFGVCLVEAIDVFDQHMIGAAIALREQKAARVCAVWRDATDRWRVLPDRERRVPIADYGRDGLDEKRQHVSEDLRRDRYHAVRRKRPMVGFESFGMAASGRVPSASATATEMP